MFGITERKIQKWGQKGNVEKLIKASKHADESIRLAAIKAMGGVDNEQVYNAMIATLRDRDPQIRIAVIDALLHLKKKQAVEHIRSLISDTDPAVSEKAREALKKF